MRGFSCPLPLKNYPTIVMGHGSGGKMMADLITHLFMPEFENDLLRQVGDSTTLEFSTNGKGSLRLAFTTDSFVVTPLIFPGGNIGHLAVNGTVNDLAMSGAQPLYLSAGFILEEGLPMETLGCIINTMADAYHAANVQLVTGDTKVVNKGHGDGLFINTSGIGLIPAGVQIAANRARPGDAIILSGSIGEHGVAIMAVREGLEFETEILSDTAPLHELVAMMLNVSGGIHCLRDATRSGIAAVLNELASASGVGITFDEDKVPVKPAVHATCEILGLDPFYLANEGKLVAIVSECDADAVLDAMRQHPFGRDACRIGEVTSDHPRLVVARTSIGGTRVIDSPSGELLPRIC